MLENRSINGEYLPQIRMAAYLNVRKIMAKWRWNNSNKTACCLFSICN